MRKSLFASLLLLVSRVLIAQPVPLSVAVADHRYLKLTGGGSVLGSTTFLNLTVTGTCTGCGGGSSVAWGAITGTMSAQTDLQSALNLKAPLNSPSLTGTPTAPTAAADTNTPQIATTAYYVGQKGTATPIIDGTATAGTSPRFAPIDHVHPTDTSRLAAANVSGATGNLAKFTGSSAVGNSIVFESSGHLGIGNSASFTGSSAYTTFVSGDGASTLQLMLGYNSAIGYGAIQSASVGSTFTDTVLNDQGGNVGIGGAPMTKFTVFDTSSSSPRGILSVQNSTDTSGARVGFSKSRGTVSTPTTVVTGDTLGRLMFRGHDGTAYLEMASIEALSTGTIATNRVPTKLVFSTATNAAPSVLTTAMTINSDQTTTFAGAITVPSCTGCGGFTAPTGTGVVTVTGGVPDAASTGTTGISNFVRATSPTLVTPTLGVATATSVALPGTTGVWAITFGGTGEAINGDSSFHFLNFQASSGSAMTINSSRVNVGSGMGYGIASTSAASSGAPDIVLSRTTTDVARLGSTVGLSDGWLQTAGACYVTADQTNATTTFASTTCSMTVLASRKYSGTCELFFNDSVSADGAKGDFNGGTATATNFIGQVTAFDTALNLSTQVTSISSAFSASTFTGAGAFEIHFSFESNAAGTFIPRFAQASHTAGTLTLARGSNCRMTDMQ